MTAARYFRIALVVERGFGVTDFSPVATPTEGWERTVVIQNTGFTRGIQVDGDKLYVSTVTTTFIYQYDALTKSISTDVSPLTLITGISCDGLEKDASGSTNAILVSTRPLTNIDVTARNAASGRSQIRRFVLPPIIFTAPATPQQWADGQVITFGIRNPVGFAFTSTNDSSNNVKSLVVVENGASIDGLSDFTTAFINDNPADELELVTYPIRSPDIASTSPQTYGFPDCATLWNQTADVVGKLEFVDKTRGFQFSLELEASRDDTFCAGVEIIVPQFQFPGAFRTTRH